MSAGDVHAFRACGCSDQEIAAFAGSPGASWGYSPEVPTKPGLYLVGTFSPTPRPLLLHWSRDNRDWRHGVRLERVDAFYGPIDLSPLHPPASPARARDPNGSKTR